MLEFIMTLFAGFLFGALLMRFLYRKVHSLINGGDLKSMIDEYFQLQMKMTQIRYLMRESEGVAGLHRNGDIATWEWLRDNGWLYIEE